MLYWGLYHTMLFFLFAFKTKASKAVLYKRELQLEEFIDHFLFIDPLAMLQVFRKCQVQSEVFSKSDLLLFLFLVPDIRTVLLFSFMYILWSKVCRCVPNRALADFELHCVRQTIKFSAFKVPRLSASDGHDGHRLCIR